MSTSHGGTARCEKPHAVNHALFGRMLGLTGLAVANQRKTDYLYGGKELPQLFGIDWYDSVARWLTTSGAFVSPDPLMEKYYSISPYAYCAGNPVNLVDPKGRDAVFITFKGYDIESGGKRVRGLGHAGVLLIDKKGVTKYYEYGRYDSEKKGVTRSFKVPNVSIGADGKPTEESLNHTLLYISNRTGKGLPVKGAYIKSEAFNEMKEYAEKRMEENNNSKRDKYSLLDNNCATFAIEVISQDKNVKDKLPFLLIPIPNVLVNQLRSEFLRVGE